MRLSFHVQEEGGAGSACSRDFLDDECDVVHCAGKAWTFPPTYFVHMEQDRANAQRVTADIAVLKSKQARMRA